METKISVITPTIRPQGLEIIKQGLGQQTFKDFEWLVEVGLGQEHDLNKAWNRMLRRAKGELVVFLQDYIKIEPGGLQTFWEAYKSTPDTFFTAPVGKSQELDYSNPKWDWRAMKYGDVDWLHCEMDWGCAPLKALIDIGGFDEELDKYWSFDNPNICFRADMAGYRFKNIENEVVAFDHDAFIEHPFRQNYNPTFHNERLDEFRHGLKLTFDKDKKGV